MRAPGDEKRARVLAALNHEEPDRVPVGEFFWGTFLEAYASHHGIRGDFDPYRHFDLDIVVITPNMDPRIQPFEVVHETDEEITVRTGWGCTVRKRYAEPMPAYLDFATKTAEHIERFEFDDPRDPRRFFAAGDDMINGVGDGFLRNIPSFLDRVNAYKDDFCVFGSVCEPYETLWRIIGSENALMMIAEGPETIARFNERIGDFMVGITEAQIRAAGGALSGLYVWGDVAYRHGLLFPPETWRELFAPQVRRLAGTIREAGLKVIYHGCGDSRAILDDLIDCGVDAYNPLEAKSGMDVVELKRAYRERLAFVGNIDVTTLARNDPEEIRAEVLRKLNAAKGGGYILQSDHSIPSNVAPASYDRVLALAREYGRTPLDLGEHDERV